MISHPHLPIVLISLLAYGTLVGALGGFAGLAAQPTLHLTLAWIEDARPPAPPTPAGQVNDASRLNATAVSETVAVAPTEEEAIAQLRELLARARRDGLKVSIGGARHTMGGHTLYPGGIALDMRPFRAMSVDVEQRLLHVGSGALWSDVLPYLQRHGLSVAVMQSNNSFSVGGSMGANCHGWQYGAPPIASTVESFRLMRTDGDLVTCSRDENAELFSLVLGGYGLFGIILDVELRVVPNVLYESTSMLVPSSGIAAALAREDAAGGVAMVYGRLSVDPDTFLDEALLTFFRPAAAQPAAPPQPGRLPAQKLRRVVFRGSVGDPYGKSLRWQVEKRFAPFLESSSTWRNDLLNEPVDLYGNRSTTSTDILHEYFVSAEALGDFIGDVRRIVRAHGVDLLNVTIRDVRRDDDTFLRYADRDVIALVMLFNQPIRDGEEEKMAAATRALIDAALARGGRYYLPYRLHATPAQFLAAYPQAPEFFAAKRRHDPDELFQNEFYRRYGAVATPSEH